MANETEQLLEQLKEMVEGFKGVGQYAKDLSAAIAASNQPLQRANDMTKAIEEQMEAVAKNSKEMSESVKTMTSNTADAITKIREMNQAHAESKARMSETREEIVKQQLETEKLRTQKAQSQVEEREAWVKMRNEQSKAHEAAESMRGTWAKTIDAVQNVQMAIAKAGYETDKFGQTTKKAGLGGALSRGAASAISTGSEIFTGQADAAGAVKSIGSAFSGLAQTAGIGGLLGMMIYGKVKDAEFNAVGESAAQMFDTIGGHSREFASRMGGVARTLSVYGMAAKEDLAQVASSFAGVGVSAKDASVKIDGFKSAVGNDLIIATLAADKALEMPAGTFAKLSGTLARDFNTSADKAFTQLMNIATAAKEAGLNATNFLQQTMEVNSALRLMNANAGQAGTTMLGLSKTMQARGMGAAYSGSYAAAGMQSAAGAVGGMGEGLSAIIGERLGYGSGLDALYSMKTGSGQSARGGQQLDLAAIMKEMKNVVTGDMGLTNRSEQSFGLQKMFGVDVAGSDAILDAMDEVSQTGKLSAKSQDELNRAFQSESTKTNQIMKWIEVIKDSVSNVMVGLLGMIVSGLKMLLNGVMLLGANLMSSSLLNGDAQSRKSWEEAGNNYRGNIESGMETADKAGGRILKGLKQGAGGVGGILNEFDLTGGWPWSKKVAHASRGGGSDADAVSDELPASSPMSVTKKHFSDKHVPGLGRIELETTSTVRVARHDKGNKSYDSGAK